jgi:choline-sulfatase
MPTDRPNVLVVFTDQQSADMLSCAGNENLETPAMDRLAESGVRFERSYCANPVCSPSRSGLLTGRFPSAIDQRRNADGHIDHVPHEIAANGLGNALREAGYDTAYAGKTHLPSDLTPERLGFENLGRDARDGCADACADFLRADREDPFCLVASFINPHDICYMAIRDARNALPTFEGPSSETAESVLDAALERPADVDEETFFAEYAPELPSNFEPQADEPAAVGECIDRRAFRRYVREEWSDERWREHRWAYARLTERVDAQIGRVLDALESTGQREDTVVIFTSDHGDMDAAHRMEHKTVLYEEAVRVPFVVSDPDGPSGTVDDRLVSLLDVLPTVHDYAGLTPPADCAGRSLRPLVEDIDTDRTTDPDWRSHVRIEAADGEALVTDRYTYALYDDGANREQLYDRETDPGETRNHAGENEAIVENLHGTLIEGSGLR